MKAAIRATDPLRTLATSGLVKGLRSDGCTSMEPSVKNAAALLLTHWAAEAPSYGRAVVHGETEVSALETRFGVNAPASFRTYLLAACSTFDDGGEMDTSYNAWWGLDRIISVRDGYDQDLTNAGLRREAATSLIFADHMVWCMAWAICCGQGPNYGRVFIINEPTRFVADDFATFVAEYVKEPSHLL